MSLRFKDQIAVITGAADGIGKAIAHRLGKEGAKLMLLDGNEELLKQTLKEFKTETIEVEAYHADISNEEQVRETVSNVEKKWRRIDVLVNAAGIVGPTNTKITDYSETMRDDPWGKGIRIWQ